MKLIEITGQHRNDFTGIIHCQHCDTKHKLTTGYVDNYYMTTVIPAMHCPNCGKTEAGKLKSAFPGLA